MEEITNDAHDRSSIEFAQAEQTELKEVEFEEERAKRVRENVMTEIIESEDNYQSDLYSLIVYFIKPLKDGRFPEISANPKGDVLVLFSTIELLFDGNTMQADLQEEMKKSVPMIGNTFLRMTESLSIYSVYFNHQQGASDTLDHVIKTSPAFKSFLDKCNQEANLKGLTLLDLIIKPFQRILKYPLLLKELLKCTPEDHPDRANITQALERLQQEVDKINKNKAKSDNFQKMLEINSALESIPKHFKFMIPSRQYVYEGTLMKISGSHNQERHFFLFNDCLMYCKKKLNGKYVCRGVIFLNKLHVDEVDDVSFKIFRSDKNLTYTLYGKSSKEKDAWLLEIQKLQGKGRSGSISKATAASMLPEKNALRIYISKDSFKTVAVSRMTTVKEVSMECAKKIRLEGVEDYQMYRICIVVNEKERVMMPNEQPVIVQENLTKQGVKFGGTDQAHFKVTLNLGQLDFYQQANIRASFRSSTLFEAPEAPKDPHRTFSPQPQRVTSPPTLERRAMSPPPTKARPPPPPPPKSAPLDTRDHRRSETVSTFTPQNRRETRSVEIPNKALPPRPPPKKATSPPSKLSTSPTPPPPTKRTVFSTVSYSNTQQRASQSEFTDT